jgi:hypothetical protein
MENRMIEGTWEEVVRRGHELSGRRVRVTVLDEPDPAPTLDGTLARLIAEAERLGGPLPTPTAPLPDRAWGDPVADKFRRQGLDL